jgi:hypothetical protein
VDGMVDSGQNSGQDIGQALDKAPAIRLPRDGAAAERI